MADVYSLSIRADTTDVNRARQALNGLSSGAIRATKTTKELSNTSQQLARTSRFSANGLRNTSLQLSQVAQQGAATGNFLQALAIQLPDLALAFGPVGIALGAVAGGLASYILGSQKAEEETKTLIERIDGLDLSYSDLNEEIRETLRLEKARAEARIQNQIAELSTELRIAEQRVKSYNNALNATGQAGARFSGAVDDEKLTEAGETVTELGGELGFLELQLQKTRERFDELITGGENTSDQLSELISKYQEQANIVGLNARQTALYRANQLGANEAQREAINLAFDRIDAEKQLDERLKQSLSSDVAANDPLLQRVEAEKRGQKIITEDQKAQAEEREAFLRQQQESSLSATSSFFSNLTSIAEAGGKDQFQAYKNLASAQAAISAVQAISATLGDPTIPTLLRVPLAFSIGALAAAQVAQIQGQTYSGARQMGGSVTGGRSYMVGENGPEIVTMGGSGVVTPSSTQSANDSGNDVIVNINNAPQGTRTESRTDSSGTRFVDVFISDLANGGPMSKQMQGTYGLRRQGR